MADKYVEIKVEGEDKIIAGLERKREQENSELRRMVDQLAKFGEHYLYGSVPVGTSKYILEHIGREGPVWMPGGAGGGGEWKAIVGIREGESRHPFYVEHGTGIYAGRGFIHPVTRLVMAFSKNTEDMHYRWHIGGQPPQHYFRNLWRVLDAYARAVVLGQRLF